MDTATTGHRLRSAREAAGLSQTELARRMGANRVTVTRVESGEKTPELGWLYQAAVAIGCKPSKVDERLTDKIQGNGR